VIATVESGVAELSSVLEVTLEETKLGRRVPEGLFAIECFESRRCRLRIGADDGNTVGRAVVNP
jgi:hypothetical protein